MKNINYPKGNFTLKQVHNSIQKQKNAMTYVGLFLKAKRDVAKGTLVEVGKLKKSKKTKGRPQALYTLTVQPMPKVKAVAKVTPSQTPEVTQ